MVKILLADRHQLVRDAMRHLLERTSDIRVVAEASDGPDTLSRFAAARPDVPVLDASMPGMNSGEVVAAILLIDPRARILLVTMGSNSLSAVIAIEAGAMGYISKHATVSELYDAIRNVAYGRYYLPQEDRLTWVKPLPAFGSLSNREEQIVSQLASGRRQTDIAHDLGLQPRTIATYLSRAARKLGLDRNREVCLLAARNNRFVTPSPHVVGGNGPGEQGKGQSASCW
jgi:two-component system invasion response regulator UvrY